MTPLRVKEIQAIPGFLDTNRILLGRVLEDKLLEVQERPLVVHFLSNLNHRFPCVLRREAGTVRTLTVHDDVFDLEYLLEDSRCEYLRQMNLMHDLWTRKGCGAPLSEWSA